MSRFSNRSMWLARGVCVCAPLALATACFSDSHGAAGGNGTVPGTDASLGGNTGSTSPATVHISRDGGAPISPFAFGQNYWNWVPSSDGTSGLSGTETLVTALRLNVIRAGGDNNDANSPPFDTTQIDQYVTYCRTVGAEPILQVPVVANPDDGGAATPQTAADMVTYANVTMGYGIKYWEIGNEPDLYVATEGPGVPLTAANYCAVFSSYAAAMRAANAAAVDGGAPLQFVGPELSYKYVAGNDWLTPFLDGCKDDVDIVSIHRYPFGATEVSIAGALGDSAKFRSVLASVSAIVSAHARPGTPLAVTEANVSYDYDITKYTATTLQASPNSYYDSLWAADALGVALENHLWTMAFWNIGEMDINGSVLGFIVADEPAPAYYGQELISANFRGNTVIPSGVPAGFSVYASYDATGAATAVVVLNKNSAASSVAIALDSDAPVSFTFPPLSTTLLQIPDDPAAATHIQQYTSALAAANMPPAQVQ